MADITLLGASYTDVPAVTLPKTGGGTVTFYENGGGGSITMEDVPNTTGITLVITTSGEPTPVETWETIYEDSINAISDDPYPYFWFGSSTISNVYPTIGSVWRVTFNGTAYRLTAVAYYSQSVGTIALIGNPKYSGGTDDGSGVPFDFFNAGWGAWSGGTESLGTYSVKLERLVTE